MNLFLKKVFIFNWLLISLTFHSLTCSYKLSIIHFPEGRFTCGGSCLCVVDNKQHVCMLSLNTFAFSKRKTYTILCCSAFSVSNANTEEINTHNSYWNQCLLSLCPQCIYGTSSSARLWCGHLVCRAISSQSELPSWCYQTLWRKISEARLSVWSTGRRAPTSPGMCGSENLSGHKCTGPR